MIVSGTRDCRVCGGEGWGDGSAGLRRDGRVGDTTCLGCDGSGREPVPSIPESRVSLDDALRVLADHAKAHRAEAERYRSTKHHQESHIALLKAGAVEKAADSVRTLLSEGVSNG